MRRLHFMLLFAAALSLLPAGCVTEETHKKNVDLGALFNETQTATNLNPPGYDPEHPPLAITITDPCYINMDAIATALTLYYGANHKLPDTLAELPNRDADGNPAFSLVCPVSGKPYLYFPQGFVAPNVICKLILFDAAESHTAKAVGDPSAPLEDVRFAIVMDPPGRDSTATPTMYVIPLKKDLLDYYLRSPQPVHAQPFTPRDGG